MTDRNNVDPVSGLPNFPDDIMEEAMHLFNVVLNRDTILGMRLSQVYAFIDKVNKEVISTFTSCSKGCSACCKINIQISTLEASYISIMTGIQMDSGSSFTKGHHSPCPFLSSKNACAIYEYRPLICRTYHVKSDPALCGTKAMVHQYGSMKADMSNDLYRNAMRWIHLQNAHSGGIWRDIRDYFPV